MTKAMARYLMKHPENLGIVLAMLRK